MKPHRVKTTVGQEKTVLLENLPFDVGESVEVVIFRCVSKNDEDDRYPLRGTSVKYLDHTEPVVPGDWDVL